MKAALSSLFLGVSLGVVFSLGGFTSWDELHKMFLLEDFRLYATFMSAVVLLVGIFAVLRKRTGETWDPGVVHKGAVMGGLLFGLGWCVTGSCPALALVQIGEGKLAAVVTFAGIVLGNFVFAMVHDRWLRWPRASCVDD